ncbi:MAG: glycine betaine ABC transporter substrate-binding protein [Pseudomonadota bacterium]
MRRGIKPTNGTHSLWALILALAVLLAAPSARAETLRVASKNFNESYLLGEIAAQLLQARGFDVERRFGLGGTLICYNALVGREIDLYVEYTGTVAQAILGGVADTDVGSLNARLTGVRLLTPIGFNNSYALVMRRQLLESLGVSRVSDLLAQPQLDIVVSHEFLERPDGWPGLVQTYALPHEPRGIEHGLAYQALADGSIDVTDAYSTDGELERYDLALLDDDRGFFPRYLAAPFVHDEVSAGAVAALAELTGRIDDLGMQRLNAKVLAGADFASVASDFLVAEGLVSAPSDGAESRLWRELRRNVLRHLQLTAIALGLAIALGVGLGVVVYRRPRLASAVIYVCGLLQTIPSIALLALMIPLFGIGLLPAIVALFLYALLPILRNTVVALVSIDGELLRTATAIGLSRAQRLLRVQLPLAMPALFAGVRTAAVISVGTATLAAFIGAGGLGDPIVTGLSLNDTRLILEGAVPAAVLAILIELSFEVLERRVVPPPLRSGGAG